MSAFPQFKTVTLRASFIEKAGASLAQELAFSLALLTEYLDAASDLFNPEELQAFASRVEVRLGVGTNYFLEIAKIRAAKSLFANLYASFGLHGLPRIHAVTTSSNKTLYDPYNNLLRATVEAMAAAVAGVDSISVAAYDQGYGAPDEFSSHLTRNTQNLLREEAYLGRVADPLGGSYAIEKLTSEYAEAAWKLFKEIEEKGGFVESLQKGFIGELLNKVQLSRTRQVSMRKRTIVGTTVYANPKEHRLQDVSPQKVYRQVKISSPETIREQLKRGADIFTWRTETPIPSTPFNAFRPSWPFEHLRLRVEEYAKNGGRQPKALLALFGDRKMRKARSMFCQSFLAAGGYDFEELLNATPESVTQKLADNPFELVILCSSDAEYLDFAQRLGHPAYLIVAGFPADQIETLQAAGVDDFIHIKLDHLATLQKLHQQFGIPERATKELTALGGTR
jgi:methylmalonyl-CoA mutase